MAAAEEFEGVVPTAEEAPAFAAFKAELAAELATEPWASFPELSGDIRLLRYLRSREADVAEAAKAYRAHLAWRKQHEVDAIRQRVVEEKMGLDWSLYPRGAEVEACCPQVLHAGFSKQGHLVQLDNMGLVTPAAVTGKQGMGLDAFSVAIIYMLEVRNKLQDDLSRETGRMVRTVQIRDMMQVTAGMVTSNKKVATSIMSMAGDNYPESIDKMIFINAGSAFKLVMTTLKAVAPPRTVARFLTYKEDAEAELLKTVNMESVHKFCDQAGHAATKCKGEPSVDGGVLTVKSREKADVLLSALQGQTVRWSWKVGKDDIMFHADVLLDDGAGWRAVPTGAAADLTAAGVAVEGCYEAAAAAVVRLRWDNTYVWTGKKEVTYSTVIEGEPPAAATEEPAPEPEQASAPGPAPALAAEPVAETAAAAEPAAAEAGAEPAPAPEAAAEPEAEAIAPALAAAAE
jgi:hypothetical protein